MNDNEPNLRKSFKFNLSTGELEACELTETQPSKRDALIVKEMLDLLKEPPDLRELFFDTTTGELVLAVSEKLASTSDASVTQIADEAFDGDLESFQRIKSERKITTEQ